MSDKWNLGSRWQRWDPHMHAPGTLRNNQFGDDCNACFRRIAEASPAPVALGITDYFSLRSYKEFVRRRPAGALPSVALVFPNIEFRLTIETKNRQGINLHFLVSPDDPDHVGRVEEKLAGLRYKYRDDWYICTDEGLRRLGKAHQAGLSDEAGAPATVREAMANFLEKHVTLGWRVDGKATPEAWAIARRNASSTVEIEVSYVPEDGR